MATVTNGNALNHSVKMLATASLSGTIAALHKLNHKRLKLISTEEKEITVKNKIVSRIIDLSVVVTGNNGRMVIKRTVSPSRERHF